MNHWELEGKVMALLKEAGLTAYEIPAFLQGMAYNESFKVLGGYGSSTLQPLIVPKEVIKDIQKNQNDYDGWDVCP